MPKKKDKPIGCTFGKSTPHQAQMVLLDNSTNLFDFVRADGVLLQVSDISAKSGVTIEEAKDIARGNKARPLNDIIAKLDVLNRRSIPILPPALVELANKKEINKFLFGNHKGDDKIHLGDLLSRKEVDISLNGKFINNHLAILGMIGMGKSNAGKVILSQVNWKGAQAVVIDPHGEYEGKVIDVDKFDVNGSTIHMNRVLKRMREVIPTKLDKTLDKVIRSVKDHAEDDNFKEYEEVCSDDWVFNGSSIYPYLMDAVRMEAVINSLSLDLLSHDYGEPLIINLKGLNKEKSQAIVSHVADIILKEGKKGHGYYLFIDEAHLYIPQKGTPVSKAPIIDLITEGRKFKCGVILLSQRPARVDKDVLSQCNSKIILKLTNENDIRQVRASTEFSTKQMFEEVQKLRIGEALLVSSAIERPVFIRCDLAK